MKKTILMLAAVAFCGTTAFAQLENKKGEAYLPESGDWAIGIDASPVLSYFGNMMNGNLNNTVPSWNFTNGGAMITGKYFASETMAYRGMLRLGFGSNSQDNYVVKDGTTSNPPEMVVDNMKTSWNAIGLGAGMEMRKGKTRLQGYYGAMFMFYMMGGKDTYTYGNDFSTTYQTPNSTDFTTMTSGPVASRLVTNKWGTQMMFGIRGFVGAEYFIIPKVSIGGEFGWGLGFSSTGEGTVTTAAWDAANNVTKETDAVSGKSSSFAIDTDNNTFGLAPAQLLIHFHF
jgi:hypothetical protein